MAVNLASKYSSKVDERFEIASQSSLVTNNDYEFTGVDTIKIFSIPTVALGNYTRSGTARYGTPGELQNKVQTAVMKQDRSWTFTIDRMNREQTMMTMEAGKALSRQTNQVIIPEYDKYVFETIAEAACSTTGHFDVTTAAAKNNAYELFLKGTEVLGNAGAPEAGRVALCSYAFANFLKQDSSFMKYGDSSQSMLIKGVIGEVDGVKIVKVPASRLPAGCNFILAHPIACCAPKQLQDYKIHDNPPGINGWLVNFFCQQAA